MKLCDSNECTGCAACVNACPVGCLIMDNGAGGFLYPIEKSENCIECGKCSAVCPALNPPEKHGEPEGALCTYRDKEKLKKSSSGGIAYAMAEKIISEGGTVFGAVYNDSMHVVHTAVSEIESLCRTQGSKYVQSETGKCYKKVISILNDEKKVLYFGTPCQIAGLLAVVPENLRENLYTCDILCGGVPSPFVFEKYTEYLEKKYKSKLISLNFRSKKYGYDYGYLHEIELSDGEKHILKASDSTYVKTVGKGYVRNSCFDCKFRNITRVSDITVGDFNAIVKNNNDGVSAVLVNSEKGGELLESIKKCIEYESIGVDRIINSQKGALIKEKKKPVDYDAFFEDAETLDWSLLSKKYLGAVSVKDKLLWNLPPSFVAIIKKAIRIFKDE